MIRTIPHKEIDDVYRKGLPVAEIVIEPITDELERADSGGTR